MVPGGGRRLGGDRLLLEDQEHRVNDGARARYIARGSYDELRGRNNVDGTGKIVRIGREIPRGPEAPRNVSYSV